MTLIIRDSRDTDLPAITAICGHAVRTGAASFEYDPPDPAEMARRRADVLGKAFPYLVAELDGAVAGYAYANIYRARPAYRFSVENSIYIASDRQGEGIGRQVLPALLQRCEALDLRLVIAVIGDSSPPSIRLHASCGFTHAGNLPNAGWKHGRWLDTVFMTRAIGTPPSTRPKNGFQRLRLWWGSRGLCPIGVKLAPDRVPDVRLSRARWICEASMDCRPGAGEEAEAEVPTDAGEQHHGGDLVDPPQRRQVVGVEQVLRGKIPGTPG